MKHKNLLGKYRRDGTPYPSGQTGLLEWAADLEKGNRVKLTNLSNKYRVSTVWLGLDHNLSGIGKPLIFETMVFKGNSLSEKDIMRYATETEAITGHKKMVAKWSKK
jgi:hypothetical protein